MATKLSYRHASRAVLIGSSAGAVADRDEVTAQLTRLRDLLTDETRWGIDPANCVVLVDPDRPTTVDLALRTAAEQVGSGGLLLVYYVGPVLRGPAPTLHLVLPRTDVADLAGTAVDYNMIQWRVRENGAARRVVILDHHANHTVAALAPDAVADQVAADPVYLVSAASAPGTRPAAFTRRLVELLDRGMPDGAHLLDVRTLCAGVTAGTADGAAPVVAIRPGGADGRIPLIRNPALYLADRVGQVLYAAGDSEPELAGAVVLILRHDAAVGAIGVVVNRVDPEPAGALAESWVAALGESVVYSGGPARPEGFIPLALLRPGAAPPQRFREVAGRLGTVALSADAAGVTGAVERVRVFSGYLGWGPGGLEADLTREVLVPAPVGPGLVLSEPPDRLWQLVQAAG